MKLLYPPCDNSVRNRLGKAPNFEASKITIMRFILLLSLPFLFTACIGDDIIPDTVEERVVITNPIDSLLLGTTHRFEARVLNRVGQIEEELVDWTSSAPEVLSIDAEGRASALAVGTADVTATINRPDTDPIAISHTVNVAEEVATPVVISDRTGTLRTTTFYTLGGDFVLKSVDDQLVLELADNYEASSNLPGLYLYLTNNPSTTANALELGEVSVYEGAHSYTLPTTVERNSYSHLLYFCKPFNVKVGDGAFDN